MKYVMGRTVGLAFWLLVGALPTLAQEAPTREGLQDRALEVLRGMADYLKSQQQFTFEGEVEEEDILSTGQKLHRHKRIRVYVRRPDRLRSETLSVERGRPQFWYDGKTFAFLDGSANTYAQVETPATIDEMIDFMFEEYDLLPPLTDLVGKDPYESVTKEVETAAYLGRDQIRGIPCHHLAFTQELIDWQAWIEDGPIPLLRKLVIDYRQEFGEPQYAVTFEKWNVNAELPDFVFSFTPPPGAKRIQFLPVEKQPESPGGGEPAAATSDAKSGRGG